jgi:hypothetical protein
MSDLDVAIEDTYRSSSADEAPHPQSPGELKAAIIKQIEFYFSDVNLPTDKHLLKQIQKDPEGNGALIIRIVFQLAGFVANSF